MAQVYYDKYISSVRSTQSGSWVAFPISGSTVGEYPSSSSIQSAVIVDSSGTNEIIFRELVITPPGYTTYDESGAAPSTGDLTYANSFIGLVRATASANFSIYTGSTNLIEFKNDKDTFLTELRAIYGDGNFRVFAEVVQSHSSSYILEP